MEESPSSLRKSASQNIHPQLNQKKPIYKYSDDADEQIFPPQIERHETGDFPHLEEDNEFNYHRSPQNATKNLISKRYKAPDNFEQNEPSAARTRQFDDSSCNVMLESTLEEKLKQTNALINEAIYTIEQHSEERVHLNQKKKFEKSLEKLHKNEIRLSDRPLKENTSSFRAEDVEPITDVTPTNFLNAMKSQAYTSPVRQEYSNVLKSSRNPQTKELEAPVTFRNPSRNPELGEFKTPEVRHHHRIVHKNKPKKSKSPISRG